MVAQAIRHSIPYPYISTRSTRHDNVMYLYGPNRLHARINNTEENTRKNAHGNAQPFAFYQKEAASEMSYISTLTPFVFI